MSKICKKHDLNFTLLEKVVMHSWSILQINKNIGHDNRMDIKKWFSLTAVCKHVSKCK